MSTTPSLQKIVELIKAKRLNEAKKQLAIFLENEPNSADGYYLAAYLVDDNAKKKGLLERALVINPQHIRANQALNKLQMKLQRFSSRVRYT